MTGLVVEGRAVNIVYQDSNKAFNTLSWKIVMLNLLMHELGKHTMRWNE